MNKDEFGIYAGLFGPIIGIIVFFGPLIIKEGVASPLQIIITLSLAIIFAVGGTILSMRSSLFK